MLIGIITANRVLVTLQFRGKLCTPLPCLSGEGRDFMRLAVSQHRFLGLPRGLWGEGSIRDSDVSWMGRRASAPQCIYKGRMWGQGCHHEMGSI